MISDFCNAAIQILSAYYLPASSFLSMPEFVTLLVQIMDWVPISVTLPLSQFNAAGIQKVCPALRLNSRKDREPFDTILMEDLNDGLADGSIQQGYYFEKAGAVTFPTGQVAFLRGDELIGDSTRPYIANPDIRNIRLLGEGEAPVQLLPLLLTAPPQVLLMLAYVVLTSIRSLIIDSGTALQAVLYVVGGQGLGKTTLATQIAGIYEKDGKRIGVVQAGSTHAAVNSLITSLRDQPVIIDDLCLSESRETARSEWSLPQSSSVKVRGIFRSSRNRSRKSRSFPARQG